MLAAYDARPTLGDLPSNIGVMLRRSTDGGTTWQAQQVVRKDAAPQGYGDPSLLVDRTNGRIFLFYAAGVNQGFFGSATGNDESDPNVLQADYSYSDDDGLTWTHRRITKQIKNPAWGGMFASSGEGIQLRNGVHKGRLRSSSTPSATTGPTTRSAPTATTTARPGRWAPPSDPAVTRTRPSS